MTTDPITATMKPALRIAQANNKKTEIKSPDSIQNLESHFSISIQIQGGRKLDDRTADILSNEISHVRDSRPQDFSLIKRIKIIPSSFVWGAYVGSSKDTINYGMPLIRGTNDINHRVLAHELGHMVGYNLEKNGTPKSYADMVNDDKNSPELFAEDYSFFLESRGNQVRESDDGKIIPNYQKRLEFFKTNFPIQTH